MKLLRSWGLDKGVTTRTMLRVTIEFVPHGDESRAEVLHTAIIANDGTGSRTKGDYCFALSQRRSARTWRSGRVRDFPRLRLGAWELLRRVLQEATASTSKAEIEKKGIDEPN